MRLSLLIQGHRHMLESGWAREDTVHTLVTTPTNQVTLYMYKSLKIGGGGEGG